MGFLIGPCRFYLLGEATGGSVPMLFIVGMFAVAAVAGGIGALTAVISGGDAGEQFWAWSIGGILAVAGWAVYTLVLIGVLWVVGRAPHTIPGVVRDAPAPAPCAVEPDELAWRRRGRDALVPFGPPA